jgi:hypothetical protein
MWMHRAWRLEKWLRSRQYSGPELEGAVAKPRGRPSRAGKSFRSSSYNVERSSISGWNWAWSAAELGKSYAVLCIIPPNGLLEEVVTNDFGAVMRLLRGKVS